MVRIPIEFVCIVCGEEEDGCFYTRPTLNLDDSDTLYEFPGAEDWDVSMEGPEDWMLDRYMQAYCPEHAAVAPEEDRKIIFCDEFPAEEDQPKGRFGKLKLVLGDKKSSNNGS